MFLRIYIIGVTLAIVNCEYKYETKTFEVPLDHFSYQRNETFKIKYLETEEFWDRGNGPIFFYTGNEGQIEAFAKNTGFMWEIAREYRAKLVFAEHRYYGSSMPFGNSSLDRAHAGYLTSSQALADYAALVDFLQGGRVVPRYPVIALGGSYGGMLAAYFRMKYPHLVAGAIAASAPVHMFPGMMPCHIFNGLVTSSFKLASHNCSHNIHASWPLIRDYAKTANGSEWLRKNWNLCDSGNSTDVDGLIDFLTSMYTTLAMVNYPFASDFLRPLPAYPVRVVCQHLNSKLDGEELLKGIGKVLEIYTNYKRSNDCVPYREGDNYSNLDASGWDYQACTEMVMPICANGKSDMFEPSPWNFTQYSADCHKKYGVHPREDDARIRYGGARLQAATNIVFTNGLLDPWAAGGIVSLPRHSLTDSVKVVVIPDAAHHLDLMASHPDDPQPVKMARDIHKENINEWINQYNAKSKQLRRWR